MERNRRNTVQGIVVSTKMAKTIVVEVETHKKHAKYAKRVKYSTKVYAHDENQVAHVGDLVTVMGCRPLSATKRFRLISVDKKALEDIKALEAEVVEEAKEEAAPAPVVEEAPKAEPVAKKAPAKKAPAKKPAAKKAPAKKAE